MAGKTYTTNVDNYNYSRENVNTVANREYQFFDLDVAPHAVNCFKLVINSEKTNYTTVTTTSVIGRSKVVKPKKVTIDEARLVILGGEFEKIGDDDEIIGGGDQKVGSANK